jgi:hypothetical protein
LRDLQNITPIASTTRLTVERRKAAVEDKLFNYKETYLAAEAELQRLTIRAPVSRAVVARVRPLDVDNILGHSGDESIRLLLSARL